MWIDEGEVRDEAARAVRRGERRPGRRGAPAGEASGAGQRREPAAPGAPEAPGDDPRGSLERTLGAQRGARLARRLDEAAGHFQAERFDDALRLLRPITREAPTVAAARELQGLALYRLERWKAAAAELEAFRGLTGSTEQHPVLADCYRALGRWHEVDELWEELRAVSPSAPIVTEGRIVAAGSLADRDDLSGAIRLLSHGWRIPKVAQDHHIRRAYALADLYERAGDVPRARELFAWIAREAPEATDASRRIRSLG